MPYQEAPKDEDIDDTIAMERAEGGWVRCSECGNRLCYVEEVQVAVLVLYCWKCKKSYRVLLGMPIALT